MVTCRGYSCYYNQESLIYLQIKSLGELTVELLVLGFTQSQRAKHGKKILFWVGTLIKYLHTSIQCFHMNLKHFVVCSSSSLVNCSFVACVPGVKLLREERRLQITKYANIKHCKACDPCLWIHTNTHTYFETQICIDLFLMWCFHLHINTPLIQCIPLDGV